MNARFLPLVLVCSSLPLAACASGSGGSTTIDTNPTMPGPMAQPTETDVRTAMISVAEDEVQWSRTVIVSGLAGTNDSQAANARLVKAENAFAQALQRYYGSAFSDQLAALLREHAAILSAIVGSSGAAGTTSGMSAATADVRTSWFANADQIAQLIASVNPNVSLVDLNAQLHAELDAMLAEVDARAAGDWAGDVNAFDAAAARGRAIANLVAGSLTQQFPNLIGPSMMSAEDEALHFGLQRLFEDNAFWMRQVIASHFAAAPDEPHANARVVESASDLGGAFSAFFGESVGTEVGARAHAPIVDAYAYMLAVESHDDGAAAALKVQWTADVDTLATYLVSQTAVWSLGDLEGKLHIAVEQTQGEINARATQDWTGDVDAYDAVISNARALSTVIADGLAQQPRLRGI